METTDKNTDRIWFFFLRTSSNDISSESITFVYLFVFKITRITAESALCWYESIRDPIYLRLFLFRWLKINSKQTYDKTEFLFSESKAKKKGTCSKQILDNDTIHQKCQTTFKILNLLLMSIIFFPLLPLSLFTS